MHAVDTNVLVRVIILGDDAAQASRAAALVARETIFISKTVLLETEWILRRSYEINRDEVIDAFKILMETENFVIEDSDVVDHALGWWEHGMDFADAIHLASSQNCDKFATFDLGIKKSAPTAQKVRILQL